MSHVQVLSKLRLDELWSDEQGQDIAEYFRDAGRDSRRLLPVGDRAEVGFV